MKTLSPLACRDMLLAVADVIAQNENILNEIDGLSGDADHGVGMARGFASVKEVLRPLDQPADCSDVFKRAGMSMLSSMGGASGVIFSTMFLGGVMGVPPIAELDGAAAASLFARALEAIKKRGNAKPGDKTMVDALEPAVSAMLEAGNDLNTVLEAGAKAAEQGFEHTKTMQASLGRARALGERSVGVPDAGAKSVALILATMRDFAAK